MILDIVMVLNCSHNTRASRKFATNEAVVITLMAQQAPLYKGSNQEGKPSQEVKISKEAEQKAGSRGLL